MKRIAPVLLSIILLVGCTKKLPLAQNEYEIKGNVSIDLKNTNLNLSVSDINKMQEVKPEKPSGFYNYYQDEEGYYYYVVSGVLTNLHQQIINSNRFLAKSKRGNKIFKTKFVIEDSARSTLIFDQDTVAKEVKFHIVSLVKDGEEPPNEFLLYYQNDLDEYIENELWDNCLKIIPIFLFYL